MTSLPIPSRFPTHTCKVGIVVAASFILCVAAACLRRGAIEANSNDTVVGPFVQKEIEFMCNDATTGVITAVIVRNDTDKDIEELILQHIRSAVELVLHGGWAIEKITVIFVITNQKWSECETVTLNGRDVIDMCRMEVKHAALRLKTRERLKVVLVDGRTGEQIQPGDMEHVQIKTVASHGR